MNFVVLDTLFSKIKLQFENIHTPFDITNRKIVVHIIEFGNKTGAIGLFLYKLKEFL